MIQKFSRDHEKVLALQTELDKNKEHYETLEMEWLELNEELENINSIEPMHNLCVGFFYVYFIRHISWSIDIFR